MSLLFCVWADQDKDGEKSDGEEESAAAEELAGHPDTESHVCDNDEDNNDNSSEIKKDNEQYPLDEDKALPAPSTESEDLPSSPPKEKRAESDVNPPKKKFVGPRSVMLKRLEKQKSLKRKEESMPTGSIILNTLMEPLTQEASAEEEDEPPEDEDRPRFFSFSHPNNSSIKDEPEVDSDQEGSNTPPSEEAYTPEEDRSSSPDSEHSKSGGNFKGNPVIRKSSRRSKTPTKYKQNAEPVKKRAKSRRNSLDIVKEDLKETSDKTNLNEKVVNSSGKRENLRRKAKPHTFNQSYDMDPESPFLYTHDRRKGPGINVERDTDEDYYPNKKIKVEVDESPRVQENETFGFGISLGSVFSLAESPAKTRNKANAEPVIIKQEPLDGWGEDERFALLQEDEPLGDPLSLKPKSLIKVRRPFIWPKLDPLFLTQIEFKLPKEFDHYMKSLSKPTAEILPTPKRTNNEKQSLIYLKSSPSLTVTRADSKDIKKPPAVAAVPEQPDKLRRSGRKSKGRYNLQGLFSDYPSEPALVPQQQQREKLTPPASTNGTPKYSLPASLTKMGCGITITPIKSATSASSPENTPDKPATEASKISSRKFDSVKLINVPWLPSGWKTEMSTAQTKGRPNTTINFISPEGLAFKTKQQVMKHISKVEKEKKSTASAPPPQNPRASNRKTERNSVHILKKKNETVKALSRDSPASTDTHSVKDVPVSNSTVRPAKPPVERYKILCKPGNYTCPLCCTEFQMNQTYGRHVVNKECKVKDTTAGIVPLAKAPWMLDTEEKEEDIHVVQESVTKAPLNYVTVINSTPEEDSYVYSSSVPALKSLSREVLPDGGIPRHPISVKEGLEYYHSIVWKDNHEELFFQKMCLMTKTHLAANVRSYEKLCKEPLKVALYLEKKIRASRTFHGKRAKRTKAWVLKYERFLKLPLHDLFLSLLDTKHKVIEYFQKGNVKVLCLNCPNVGCAGCVVQLQTKGKARERSRGKLKVPIRVKSLSYAGNAVTSGAIARPVGPKTPVPLVPNTRTRCNSCKGCKRPPCGQCINCFQDDKNPDVCLFRKCINMSSSTDSMSKISSKVTITADQNVSAKNSEISVISPMKSEKVSNLPSSQGSAKTPTSSGISRIQHTNNRRPVPYRPVPPSSSGQRADRVNPGRVRVLNQVGGLYPCTVCRKGFKTRIEMIAHRSDTHKKKVKPTMNADRSAETVIDLEEADPIVVAPTSAKEPATFSLMEQDEDDDFQRDLMNAINESLGSLDQALDPVMFD